MRLMKSILLLTTFASLSSGCAGKLKTEVCRMPSVADPTEARCKPTKGDKIYRKKLELNGYIGIKVKPDVELALKSCKDRKGWPDSIVTCEYDSVSDVAKCTDGSLLHWGDAMRPYYFTPKLDLDRLKGECKLRQGG